MSKLRTTLVKGRFLILLLCSVVAANIQAATYTWGNSGTDFDDGASWLGGSSPFVTTSGTAIFNVVAGTNPLLDTSGTINSLQFSTAAASGYTLSGTNGAVLTLMSTGATAATSALNNAITSGSNTISANLNFGAAAGSSQYFFQAAGGTLALSGTIASDNSINLTYASTGTYVINAANTYSGTTTQSAGSAILVGNKGAFSDSVLNFASNSGRIGATTDLTGANKLTNAITLGSNETILNGSAIEFGGNVDLSGAQRTITNNNAAGTTFSGTIGNDGGNGIIFAGSGPTFLTAQNTYSGPTTISGNGGVVVTAIGNSGSNSYLGTSGTINVGNATSAGFLRYQGAGETTDKVANLIGTTGGATIDTTGATGALIFSSSFATSGTGNKTLTLTGDTLGNAINGSILNPVATGTLSVTKSGAGSWILSGSNAYTGNTSVSAGVLNIRNSNALGTTSGSTTVSSGAALELQDGITVAGETLNISSTGVGGNGALRNISGANTWSGFVGLTGNAEIQSDAGTLTLSGTVSSANATARALTVDGAGNTAINAIGSLITTVTKTGLGRLTLSGTSSQTGATILLNGALELDFSAATAPTTNILNPAVNLTLGALGTANSGTLILTGKTGAVNSQSIATSGSLATTPGAYHINLTAGGGGSTTLNLGVISGTTIRINGFSLDFGLGAGTAVTTTTANTAAGIIANGVTVNGTDFATVSSGTVAAFTSYVTSTTNSLGTTNDVVNAGTNTVLSGVTSVITALRFNDAAARSITLSGTTRLTVGGGILVTANVGNNLSQITGGMLEGAATRDLLVMQNNTANALEIGSSIVFTNNGGYLTKSGAGDLILSGTSAYLFTNYLNEGKTIVTSDAVAGLVRSGTVTGGSNVITGVDTTGLWIGQRVNGVPHDAFPGGRTADDSLIITGIDSINNTITVQVSATSSWATTEYTLGMSAGSGLGSNVSGTSVLVGSAATLQIGNGGASGSLLSGQGIINNGTVILNRSNAFTFSNTMTGAGSVVQAGTGTTTLEGVQAYTGNTLVNAGTLLVNGSAAGSRAVVENGGILGGSGTVGGLTVNAGGKAAPGNSIGTLSTNNGSFVWNGESSSIAQMLFELNAGSNASDQLNLGTGMFDKGTGSVFAFDFLGTGGGGFTYTLINFGSTDFSVENFSYTNLASGLTGSFILNDNSLQFSVVPEPSTALLLAGGLSLLLVFRRRN